ncbi:hypothetical protein LCGC14_0018610 [marine sediment metagenome]|uniref:Alpha-acetolactate decarboxylase n=1 Tax=marine sediment metagenome TaxID=412755 RepID=A0A0F9W4X8_9ZZZZ
MRALIAPIAAALMIAGCSPGPADPETLYQTSTITALMAGAYDGRTRCGQLTARGDFGLGTFNALDGEMVVLDGVVYQVRVDDRVSRAGDAMRTPFAVVTFFDADAISTVVGPIALAQLRSQVDSLLAKPNLPYAVRIDGLFKRVTVRSVPRQNRPYPELAEVVKDQAIFELHDVRGTVIGFALPQALGALNVAGHHWHFLTADRNAGGHVLDLVADKVTICIDDCDSLYVAFAAAGKLTRADLTPPDPDVLHRIENQPMCRPTHPTLPFAGNCA